MSIGPNKVVTMNYTLKDSEGVVIDTTENKEAFLFLSGANQILPKLEKEIETMLIGSKKNVKLSAEDAYGVYDENAVQKVGKSNFPEDTAVEVGMGFMANSPDGQPMPFKITAIEGDEITIDFNHPLAGKDLVFDVHLVDVRDASKEEMEHGHAHGPDGGHHH
jgi:FKBP-type peptidyl-prolyl cis-trans isomerase SlyD